MDFIPGTEFWNIPGQEQTFKLILKFLSLVPMLSSASSSATNIGSDLMVLASILVPSERDHQDVRGFPWVPIDRIPGAPKIG